MKLKIMFDFSSTGLWNDGDNKVSRLWQALGLTRELGVAIEQWNDIFDSLVCAGNVCEHYKVSKEIADLMRPLGEHLTKMLQKELPEHEVRYHYYFEGSKPGKRVSDK